MSSYNKFARFYNSMIHHMNTDFIHEIIDKNNITNGKVLELGCGTGNVLENFDENKFELYGIDNSMEMLKIAHERIPNAKFFHKDMSSFNLPIQFDIILCIYDSINHLLNFNEWTSLFKNAKKHLSENGIFIFDINTLYKLNLHSEEPPFVKKSGNDYMILNVNKINETSFSFDITIFEHVHWTLFQKTELSIIETSYEIEKIKKSLQELFSNIEYFDKDYNSPADNTGRVIFISSNKEVKIV